MNEKLKCRLEELQNELQQIDSSDPILKKLAADVHAALNQTSKHPHALGPVLQHVAEEFEVKHPQLTSMINQVMTSLSSIGI